MPNRGVLDPWRRELHAARGIFSKNLVRLEKSRFLPVFGQFCMRALWRGFDTKMPIFWPRFQFLVGSSQTAAIFSNRTYHWSLIMRFLDSWLHAASAGYRVGEVYRYISGIKSNNWVYFRQVCQVVCDCMEPDHTAKYSLPVLTDLTENLIQKKPTFYVLTPLWNSSEGVFGRVSAFCVHPCGFCLEKSEYWQKYKGGKFCSVLTESTILEYSTSSQQTQFTRPAALNTPVPLPFATKI